MNYHQGLKTELEARMPELTACQELGALSAAQQECHG